MAASVETQGLAPLNGQEPRGVGVHLVVSVRRIGEDRIEATVADPVPAQFFFRDPDGNCFLIVQPD